MGICLWFEVVCWWFGIVWTCLWSFVFVCGFCQINHYASTCTSLNRPYQARPTFIIANSYESLYYSFVVTASSICNIIVDPHALICVPDNLKNTNIKVLNLMKQVF